MQAARELIALVNECYVSRCLHAAVDLRLADTLGDRSLTVEELATATGACAFSIEAVIRVLSGRGIFAMEQGRVVQTVYSQLLREDHPDSIRDIVSWLGSHESWMALGFLPESLIQRKSGFELAYGQRLFEYLARNRARHEIFSRSMATFTTKEVQAVVAAVDLSRYRKVVDLGGGAGLLAREIARRYPDASVEIFELPGVAPSPLELPSTVAVTGGDFFQDPLPAADLTILMNVLHDWSDEDVTRLLAAVRRSNGTGGHICVIEGLLDTGQRLDMVNLGMVVMTGGRQRRRDELEALLGHVGYTIFNEARCSDYLSALIARADG